MSKNEKEEFRRHLQQMGHFDQAERVSSITPKSCAHEFIELPDASSPMTKSQCKKCGFESHLIWRKK